MYDDVLEYAHERGVTVLEDFYKQSSMYKYTFIIDKIRETILLSKFEIDSHRDPEDYIRNILIDNIDSIYQIWLKGVKSKLR